jgi:hypothetical protein
VTGSETNIQVNAAAGVALYIGSMPSSSTAGTAVSFYVMALDAYNNRATSYLGTVHFTSSDVQAVLPADYTFVPGDQGRRTFTATLKTAGTQSVTATDTSTPAMTRKQSLTVTPAAASSFAVTGYPTSTSVGASHTFVVTALDPYGNVATGYTGTVMFASSDPGAILPVAFTFSASNAGTFTFTATFETAGTQSLVVTDKNTASVKGSETGIVVQ